MEQQHKILIPNPPFEIPPLSFPSEIVYRKDATPTTIIPDLLDTTILATPSIPLSYDLLTNHAPNLQLIISQGTGTDHVNALACRERGIVLCNTPAQNIASVSEHAVALLGALKRRIVPLHALALDGHSWAARQTLIDEFAAPPRTNADEVLGVVGYGALGSAVADLARALGMRVLLAERKGASCVRPGRVAFAEVLRLATCVVLTAPLDASTRHTVDAEALAGMRRDAVLVNVGRGGLVDEAALAVALREGRIAGAATDVFACEPATRENCPLLEEGVPNLVLSPHVAWYSRTTVEGARRAVHETVEAFVRGEPRNVIIGGRAGTGLKE